MRAAEPESLLPDPVSQPREGPLAGFGFLVGALACHFAFACGAERTPTFDSKGVSTGHVIRCDNRPGSASQPKLNRR